MCVNSLTKLKKLKNRNKWILTTKIWSKVKCKLSKKWNDFAS